MNAFSTAATPQTIPRNDDGTAQPNQWAFYPVFPLLARLLSNVTGLAWARLGCHCGHGGGPGRGLDDLRPVQALRLTPNGPVGCGLLCHVPHFPGAAGSLRRIIGHVLPGRCAVPADQAQLLGGHARGGPLCLSRPAGAPFAAVVGIHLLLRFWHRKSDPFPARDMLSGALLAALSVVMAFCLDLHCLVVDGGPDRLHGHGNSLARRGAGPVQALVRRRRGLGGSVLGPAAAGAAGGAGRAVSELQGRAAIGRDLRIWCGMYLLYLMAVLHPQSSTFRMLLPLFPLALAAAFISTSKAYRWSVLVMFGVLQIVWVVWLWQFAAISTGQAWPP